MRFAVLGPLLVTGRTTVTLERRSHRRLLSILLFASGQPVERDVLIDRFWGELAPPSARAALQTHVSQLRRILGAGVVATEAGGYRLDLAGHTVDVVEFEALVRDARSAAERAAWSEVDEAAARATALWRGPPYSELEYDEFAAPELSRLDELRAEAIELRAEALLALGRSEQALPDLERFVLEYPYRERLLLHLMLARVRVGRITEALAAYHEARARLEEIGLELSPGVRELEERILREDPALVPPRVRHNLPTRITSFVGRAGEVSELIAHLGAHRLITLTGVGGSGKTRLAIELAERVLERYPDGVWLVDLAGTSDPDLVANEVAIVLGLRGERPSVSEALTASLRGRTVLILLDNCEHLLTACAQLAERLVRAGPRVTVLATSREALGVDGELIYPVPPLATPAPDEEGAEVVAHDSVRLFADRAALSAHGFTITADNASTVANICRRLDGLPLAIELAASRMSSLSPEDVADRLDNRFRLLARSQPTSPARHQTLDATVGWSYDHLSDAERALLARLSVFSGGFTLAMVETICTDARVPAAEAASLTSALVDKSLIVAVEATEARRYRQLETIKDYARARLRETGAAAEFSRRHADWFLAMAEEAARHLEDETQLTWLDRLEAERDNLQAALDWSRAAHESAHVAALADALGWYRAKHGQFAQANADVRLALAHLGEEPEREAALRVRLAGALYSTGEEHAALEEAGHARDLVMPREPSAVKVRALTEYADLYLRIVQEDPRLAIAAAREAVATASQIADRAAEMRAFRMLGSALASAGEVEEGVAHLRRALRIAKELGAPSGVLGVHMRLQIALVEFARDERAAAEEADEALAWLDAGGDRLGGAASLAEWICYGFIKRGDWARAESTLGRVEAFHLEGSVRSSMYTLQTLLRWMRGRLDDAAAASEELRASVRATRYFRVLYPLLAQIRADQGDLPEVRRLTEEHLEAEVREAEQATKVGTLCALLRAEADAADATTGSQRQEHERRARAAMDRIRDLLERFPPRILAGFRLETPETFLLLAEAELSRVSGADPDRWRRVIAAASFEYWRVYARWRLGESLLARGRGAGARREMVAAYARATALGAEHLGRRIAAAAERAGIDLAGAPARRA
jgi:predicted ATPase/DNA-binding SARP family transcriptional activator